MRSLVTRGFVALPSHTTARFAGSSAIATTSGLFSAYQRRQYCISIKVPIIAESVNEGKINFWNKKVGDTVAEDEDLCEVGSDKKEVNVKAPTNGVLTAITSAEGAKVLVGQEIATMKAGDAPKKDAGAPKTSSSPTPKAPEVQKPTEAPKAPTPSPQPTSQPPPGVVTGSDPRTRRVRTSAMRQRIADRLKASQNTAAMLTTFNEIDMGNLMELREKYAAEFLKKHGVKFGFMSAFTKASAAALMDVPIVNATWEDEFIAYHDYVDISVAVATPTGLVVPVLRDVQDMSFADIEKKIAEYGEKAKEKRLSMAEMTGGTFTISNGGVYGSWLGTPIINPPQSAILGMHATKKKPWVDAKGNIVVRPIMAVALTYDHRLIDGRDAVTFLVKIKNLIEDPTRLVLDLP